MKKALKILLIVLLVIIAALALLIAWLSVEEYKPESVETLEVSGGSGHPALKAGEELDILSWNIGYAGLGKEADFFMDGGSSRKPVSKELVLDYLEGIKSTVDSINPDLLMLQEVDMDSARSYRMDQRTYFGGSDDNSAYALNYACPFVPIPMPPMGRVFAGQYTVSFGYAMDEAERHALPCPFSWPVSAANLKRCLLVTYHPIEGSDRQLVLINLHLEAYDSGEGKIAQTKQLVDFVQSEYEKGNYVIAGGDFNQSFPGALDVYPMIRDDLWTPGTIESDMLPADWSIAAELDDPSCRLLNQPYDPSDSENTQYYIIDGFILSPNVELKSLDTIDAGFEYSDHNPVLLKAVLK